MSLSSILEQIKTVKPIAEMDILVGPRETYAGREGMQRNAKEEFKTLKEQYTNELRQTAAFILVSGSVKESFQTLATTEFDCFSADSEGFYKALADRIPAELYANKTPAGNLFDVMGRHLEDMANDLGIIGYPQLIFKQQYQRAVDGKADFVKLIKQAINEQVGSEIVGIYTAKALTDEAIAKNHGLSITPIVMTTDDETLALELNETLYRAGSRAFLVAAGKGAKSIRAVEGAFAMKEVDSESVKNVLTNISKMCKNIR